MPGIFTTATSRFTDEKMAMEKSEESVSRYSVWGATVKLINNHMLFGIGLGEKKFIHKVRMETNYIQNYGHILDNPHNSYLHIAVMTGMLNLIIFLALNYLILKRTFIDILYNRTGKFSNMSITLVAGIFGYLFCIIMDMQMFTHVAVIYWAILGICNNIYWQTKNQSNGKTTFAK
jgi:O-antigen ligase